MSEDHSPIRARDVAPEKVDWLWRDRVARKMLNLNAGPPGAGKSLLNALVAAEVSRTDVTCPMTGKRRKGRVLYSAIEDAPGVMTRPRLEVCGADLDQIDLWRFILPLHFQELAAHLTEGVDLLVIDPVAAHLSGVSRYSDSIRDIITPLSELIEATGTAVLLTEHTLKRAPRFGDPLRQVGGSSSGLVSACRMAFMFGIDPDDGDTRIMCNIKHAVTSQRKAIPFTLDVINHAVGEVPYLDPRNEIEFNAWRLVEQASGRTGQLGRPPAQRAAAAQWITTYLYTALRAKDKEYPVPAGVVAEDSKQSGITWKTLGRAASDQCIVKTGAGPATKWGLPQDLIDLEDMKTGRIKRDDLQLTDEDIEKLLDPEAGKQGKDGHYG